LTRVRALVEARLFAHAMSMLTAIKSTLQYIHSKAYSDMSRVATSSETTTLQSFDTSANGLAFHGAPPFCSNLPPTDAANRKATQWVIEFPAEFDAICSVKDDISGGNVKADVVSALSDSQLTLLQASVKLLSAQFVYALAASDTKTSASHSPVLSALSSHGDYLTNSVIKSLHGVFEEKALTDPLWVSVYCRAQLLQNASVVQRRQFKSARASVSELCNFLRCPQMQVKISPNFYIFILGCFVCVSVCHYFFFLMHLELDLKVLRKRFTIAAQSYRYCLAIAAQTYRSRFAITL
jgi:hypothetical protein